MINLVVEDTVMPSLRSCMRHEFDHNSAQGDVCTAFVIGRSPTTHTALIVTIPSLQLLEYSDVCVSCLTNDNHFLQRSLFSLPHCIVFHFRRYRTLSDGTVKKLPAAISFPQAFRRLGRLFRLTGVVSHHGLSTRSGHYTAYTFSDRSSEL